MSDTRVHRLEQVLLAQREALVSNDLAAFETSNRELIDALAALRVRPPTNRREAIRLRAMLRGQAELIGRAHASNHLALTALTPPSSTYGDAGNAGNATASTRSHFVA